MWAYYKANKTQIHSDIRGFREVILAELIQGAAAEDAFARFALNPEPAAPASRARKK